jgi:hypothetical protein
MLAHSPFPGKRIAGLKGVRALCRAGVIPCKLPIHILAENYQRQSFQPGPLMSD